MSGKKLDFTHKINHLSFGEINDAKLEIKIPGIEIIPNIITDEE